MRLAMYVSVSVGLEPCIGEGGMRVMIVGIERAAYVEERRMRAYLRKELKTWRRRDVLQS